MRLSELASRASDAKAAGVGCSVPVSSPVRQGAMVPELLLKESQVYGLADGHGCRAESTKAAARAAGSTEEGRGSGPEEGLAVQEAAAKRGEASAP